MGFFTCWAGRGIVRTYTVLLYDVKQPNQIENVTQDDAAPEDAMDAELVTNTNWGHGCSHAWKSLDMECFLDIRRYWGVRFLIPDQTCEMYLPDYFSLNIAQWTAIIGIVEKDKQKFN